jgi:hypothetical protein
MAQITIDKIPQNIDEFIEIRNKFSATPEGGAAIFMLALKVYIDNNNIGHQCIVSSVDLSCLQQGDIYKGFKLNNSDFNLMKSQFSQNPKIPASYIQGAVPENNYETKLPFVYEITSITGDNDYFKVFVKCNGADSPRPVHVKKNDKGLWKAINYSSLFVGIKKPPVVDDI